ncbi:calcium-binding protein KRP1-like [Malus sylvestris]|nr:calcium-binding protein KRP1-like [Malus sylvestris]
MASLSWKTLPPRPSSFIYSPTYLFPHQQTYPFTHSLIIIIPLSLFSKLSMASQQTPQSSFQDLLPTMADKLGGDGLIGELCNGFNLLMDSNKGVITFESLKRNSALLGLQDLSDDDLRSMLDEGDFDGDGALNQMEFCVLMFRLSPELMDESKLWLEDALQQEFKHYY